MVQPQDYHYTDWEATESIIPYCGSYHNSICRCTGAVSVSTQNCTVLYTYITMSGSFCRRVGDVQASWHCFMLHTHIHYTARLHLQVCWVWVIFSTKSYCVIHFMSHYEFPHCNNFPSAGKPIEHVSVKLLEIHHDHAEQTVHWNAHEYFQRQND